MLKHIGNHNNKRVVILYHQVPNEDHMCLVVYSDLLPRMIHDEIMKCLESPVGQQATNFADALFRVTMSDGRNALTTIHQEGFIKKLPTNQVIVTPTPNAKIRLDELNNLLTEMAKGEDAIKKLQTLDDNLGLKMPPDKKTTKLEPNNVVVTPSDLTVLTDEDIAKQRLDQAATMRKNAEGLLAEAARLESEANSLLKVSKAPRKNARTTKKTTAKEAQVKAD